MATAPTRSDLHLPTLTGFLSLAPITSTSYPTHRRTVSSPPSDSSVAASIAQPAPQATAAVAIPDEAVVDADSAAIVAAPVIPTVVGKELKLRRSSSMSSEGSNGAAKKWRFLRLGPVHHGEQDGDWSEEVAIIE